MTESVLVPMLLLFGLPAMLVALALVGMLAYRTHRSLRHHLSLTSQLMERVEVAERKSHAAVEFRSDQARRIAWLETRVRHRKEAAPVAPADAQEAQGDGNEVATPKRDSMIERRHRVLALSRRGLDVQTIADTLCLPHGEVELILALALRKSGVGSPGAGVFPAQRETGFFGG